MKGAIVAGILFVSAVAAARSGGAEGAGTAQSGPPPGPGWTWVAMAEPAPVPAGAAPAPVADREAQEDHDVVDAHWMALTLWGEARGEGEAARRAVGHVIDNRRRLGRHGDFVTDTVSEAWQFSCWNPDDPNRQAIEDIGSLAPGSAGHRAWLAARRIADEILSGRSTDPTGGALFYHTTAVSPAWSRGVEPVAQIGSHLFFTHTA